MSRTLKEMPGIHVEHFGCRAARADAEAIGGHLHALCEEQPLACDVVVVNTCSVTAEADRQARAFIRKAHRANPQAKIVVTGCYAQRAPGELAGMEGVAAVIGNSHKGLAPQIIADLTRGSLPTDRPTPDAAADAVVSVQSLLTGAAPTWVDDRFAHSFLEEAPIVPGLQTRPNLKIQEGCGNRCTFCVIPLTRGPSKSLTPAAVMRQVGEFVAAGGKELVLSGINLGRWGRDLESSWSPTLAPEGRRKDGAPRLALLVREILEQTALPRLRLSSIEPMDWDEELIGLMAEFGGTHLARHAHLPLQSGSDAVLRRMHRRYRPWHYAEKVEALVRAAGAELTVGADVMAGFPGETDAEFEETLDFVRALPFGYLHLFPFSPRPATRGWALHAQAPVPPAVVEERMARLRALATEKTRAHRCSFVGRALDAITLHTSVAAAARGRTAALTENFLPVEIEGRLPANELLRIRMTALQTEMTLRALHIGVSAMQGVA